MMPAEPPPPSTEPALNITYRRGFSIAPHGEALSADAGWGCTLRATQTLYARALARASFSRDARAAAASVAALVDDEKGPLGLAALLASADAPPAGASVARWRGPFAAATLLARASARAAPPLPLAVVLCRDATVAADEVARALRGARAALLLVPARLEPGALLAARGAAALEGLLALPTCVGAVAGTPGHALFLLPRAAPAGAPLSALDPHRVQISARGAALAATLAAAPEDRRDVAAGDLEPSVAVGFVVTSGTDLDALALAAPRACAALAFVASRAPDDDDGDAAWPAAAPASGEWVDAAPARARGDLLAAAREGAAAAAADRRPAPPPPPPRAPSLRSRLWAWWRALLRALRRA